MQEENKNLKLKKSNSVSRKVLVPITIIGILISACTILFINQNFEKELLQNVTQRAHTLAEALEYSSRSGSRLNMLSYTVGAMAASRNVKNIIVMHGDSLKIFASTKRVWRNTNAKDLPNKAIKTAINETAKDRKTSFILDKREGIFTYSLPIVLTDTSDSRGFLNRKSGITAIQLDVSAAIKQSRKDIAWFTCVMMSGILLIVFTAYFLLQRYIFIPIASVIHTMNERSKGNNTAYAQRKYNDEIGLVASALNIMLDKSECGAKALKELNENLEKKVAERTAALESQTEKLQQYTDNLEWQALELEGAKAEAEESTRLKSDFLATMSHEIRTPMNGIFGMAELLMETELTTKQEGHIKTLMSSADALLTLIDDILDFSKIEAGKLELEPIPFDLHLLVEDVAELLSIRAQEKAVEMIVRYKPDTAEHVVGDSGRIRQIINNLVGNAIKFTEKGHVLITVEPWELSTHPKDKVGIKISISDTGIGIPEGAQAAIFEKFSQADASTTRKFGGTGLGLAICKQLSFMMDGKIGVESQPNKGSIFWFTMVLGTADIIEESPKTNSDRSILKGVKVLVVDDIEVNCMLLKEQLISIGMQCTSCTSPAEALLVLHEAKNAGNPFQMAVLDYLMPVMNGETLANTIKEDPKISDIALIMASSAGGKGARESFAKGSFSACTSKPIRIQKLFAILAQIWDAYCRDGKYITLTEEDISASNKQCDNNRIIFENTRILLVEDNRVNQEFVLEMLGNFGCDVDVANNGKVALGLVKSSSYDLILMDCQMPEMDGFEASQRIAAMKHNRVINDVPIVALTANAMKGDRERCIASGMQDYLTKPVRKSALVATLMEWLPEKINKSDDKMSQELNIKERFKNTKILLAEDDCTNCIMTTRLLESLGCTVTVAENGKVAVNIISRQAFDLVFMDCAMPVMDGYEASTIIRDLRNKKEIADVTVVALTANAMRGDREKCLEAGMDDYIAKPIQKQKLKEILTKWVSGEDIINRHSPDNSSVMILDAVMLNDTKQIMQDKFFMMIKYYLEDTATYIEHINTAIAANDMKATIIPAHTIKSCSNQLGAIQVGSIAEKMEALAKEEEVTIREISTLLEQLERAFNNVEPEYKKLLNNKI